MTQKRRSESPSAKNRAEPGPPPPSANQAKDEPVPASREESGDPAPVDAAPADPAPTSDDDLHRRYREALEKKQHRASKAGAAGHDPSRSPIPTSNTKRQRTFRRKSGG